VLYCPKVVCNIIFILSDIFVLYISLCAGSEGDDETVLNMMMHSHGNARLQNTLTGSTARMPKAKDYPPEGTNAVLLDFSYTISQSINF